MENSNDELKLLEQEIKERNDKLEIAKNNSPFPLDSLEHNIYIKGIGVMQNEISVLSCKLNRKKEEACAKNGGHFCYITGYSSHSDPHASYSEASTVCLFCDKTDYYRARYGMIDVSSIDYTNELEDFDIYNGWKILGAKVKNDIAEGKSKKEIIMEIKKNKQSILKTIKEKIKAHQLSK